MARDPGGLSVRLAADPASVPGVRRFVVDALAAWGRSQLAEAGELVASELAGNAALHAGATFMHVQMTREGGGVRVAVEDDGTVGAEAVEARAMPAAAGSSDWEEQGTTGRGLAIVAMLAHRWGVETTSAGKRVWADLVETDDVHDVRPPLRASAAPEEPAPDGLPPGWVLVRLAECPVELSLRQDQHLDELVRELQLLGSQSGPQSRGLAEQIQGLLLSPAHARLTGRRTAERARDAGSETVDVEMAMPREFHVLVQQLHESVTRADVLCEEGLLLTLASSPELRSLRAWMTHEIVAQATQGAPPVPWHEWLDRQTG
jgi:anti-sigma regulatory factor (Ser/Thr protein kinase)